MAKKTGIPDRTLRRYIEAHSDHIDQKREGRSYLISEESVNVIQYVRGRYISGATAERISEELSERFSMILDAYPAANDEEEAEGQNGAHLPEHSQSDSARIIAMLTEHISSVEAKMEEQNRQLMEQFAKLSENVSKIGESYDAETAKRLEEYCEKIAEQIEAKRKKDNPFNRLFEKFRDK